MGSNIVDYKLVLAAFLLAAFVQSASSLRCWSCSSDLSPDCADPLNATEHNKMFHTQDCSMNIPSQPYLNKKHVCLKKVQRVSGERIVIRACSFPNPDESDIVDGPCSPVPTASYITVESCHICTSDYCNSATSVSGSMLFSVIAMTAAALCRFSRMSLAI